VKVGLYGGTFDPIHCAHLIIAQFVKEELALDKIVFIPSGSPPHKDVFTPADLRLEMVRLAISDYPDFEISRVELENPDISYSVETIAELKNQFRLSRDELYWIIGSDSFLDLPQWKAPRKIVDMCRLIVVPRKSGDFRNIENKFKTDAIYVESPVIEISSTQIRELVGQNRSIRNWVPVEVEELIRAKQLYL